MNQILGVCIAPGTLRQNPFIIFIIYVVVTASDLAAAACKEEILFPFGLNEFILPPPPSYLGTGIKSTKEEMG